MFWSTSLKLGRVGRNLNIWCKKETLNFKLYNTTSPHLPYFHVQFMYSICTVYVLHLNSLCTPSVQFMYLLFHLYSLCDPYVLLVYSLLTVNVLCIYSLCTLLYSFILDPNSLCTPAVQLMYSICVLFTCTLLPRNFGTTHRI